MVGTTSWHTLIFALFATVAFVLAHQVQSKEECSEKCKENESLSPLKFDPENAAQVQLTIHSANHRVLKTEYAVRGPILMRALEIEAELKEDPNSYPFDTVVKCNIGNPQSLGQKPITFTRQVLSLLMNPELMQEEAVMAAYPDDVVARANMYLEEVRSVGAYSASNGISVVRQEVADFIERRDSVKVDANNVFLTSGASEAVEMIMRILIRSNNDAILTPIPQYPLYSALTTVMDGHFAPYYMGEESGWELDMEEVKRALLEARSLGKTVRAMVVINPGNPTGSVLSDSNLREIIQFCIDEKLVLLADEVYQRNIYSERRPFKSFRKVVSDMGYVSEDGQLLESLQLASFHSISKGVVGECGLRGGYVELLGFSEKIKEQIYKLASIKLCSNVPGQIAVGLMVNPPQESDASFPKYFQETTETLNALKRRAVKLEKTLNSLHGITCQPIDGAMYAFPQITLPERFVRKALDLNEKPDSLYSLEVLENTGVVIVPGSGFGERSGTYNFRTTFLPPEDVFDRVLERFTNFHSDFMAKWEA